MDKQSKRAVKCLVWDLDRTLWQGVLSEDGPTPLREGVRETLEELDRRGILLSVASKNEPGPALEALEALGVRGYFLCPQISWGDKAGGIRRIAEQLNLKLEAFALIDDSAFERDAVQFALPGVAVYPETAVGQLTALPEFTPRFVTEDSRMRRKMYQDDLLRRQLRESFTGGSSEDFLETLGIQVSVKPVCEADLQRVEELTVRTHQLNSTGYEYSYEDLLRLSHSPDHIFLVCGMRDKYGDSGKVGLLLLALTGEIMTVKLLIVSCRVMSYGIGGALAAYAVQLADRLGKRLRAEFLQTQHNRIMYITYKFAGFEEIREDGDSLLLEYQGEEPPVIPSYLHWEEEDIPGAAKG